MSPFPDYAIDRYVHISISILAIITLRFWAVYTASEKFTSLIVDNMEILAFHHV